MRDDGDQMRPMPLSRNVAPHPEQPGPDHSGEVAPSQSAAPLPEPGQPEAGGQTSRLARLVQLTKAVADADAGEIETAVRQIGESRRYLTPIAWAAGASVLLIRGIKLLIMNWRLSLIELIPAAWIWVVMWDLKQHSLRGAAFRETSFWGTVLLGVIAIGMTFIAIWCNTVFAFAVDSYPPSVRPAARRTKSDLPTIAVAALVLGLLLTFAAIVVPKIGPTWLYVVTLGGVLSLMLINFVAVPARIIGLRRERLPPRQAVGNLLAGGALSAVAMGPGFLLDRIGLILLGVSGLQLLGLVLLSIGTALYAAGMSSVRAVKLSMKLNQPK
jgi:hypothetical protein